MLLPRANTELQHLIKPGLRLSDPVWTYRLWLWMQMEAMRLDFYAYYDITLVSTDCYVLNENIHFFFLALLTATGADDIVDSR